MIKMLFIMDTIVILTALFFLRIGLKYHDIDEYNLKGIEYILGVTRVTGMCIILNSILFIPIFFSI